MCRLNFYIIIEVPDCNEPAYRQSIYHLKNFWYNFMFSLSTQVVKFLKKLSKMSEHTEIATEDL